MVDSKVIPQNVSIINREKLEINQVEEIVSSSEKEVYLKLVDSMAQIIGENLKITKLIPEDKTLTVTGKIIGFNYLLSHITRRRQSICNL